MNNQLHIYIYYNIEYSIYNIELSENSQFIIQQSSIIRDQSIVRNILNNLKNILNEYGEFTHFDYSSFLILVQRDIHDNTTINNPDNGDTLWSNHVHSFYYIKCVVVPNINEQIQLFKNNIV